MTPGAERKEKKLDSMKYRDDGEVNGIKDRRMDGQGGKGKAAVRKEKMGGLRIYIQKQIP